MVGFGIPFALILVGLSGYAVSAVYQCDSSYINLTCGILHPQQFVVKMGLIIDSEEEMMIIELLQLNI